MPIPNSADATFTAQAEPDALDLRIIQDGLNGIGVASGCACTPASSGSTLGVAVASGTVYIQGNSIAVTSGTVTPGAASGSNPRFDLVTVDTSGTKAVVAGTAAASPVFPTVAADRVVLASVWIPTSATSITAGNIVDKRQMLQVDPAATVPGFRRLGTGSAMAAAGDHTHAGAYASTAHAATHAWDGSDPLPWAATATNGTGVFWFSKQTTKPADPADSRIGVHSAWVSNGPLLRQRLSKRDIPLDAILGHRARYGIFPNSSTTALTSLFGPLPSVTNLSHPTPTTAHGPHFNIASTASVNTRGNVDGPVWWARGDTAGSPWLGALALITACFPDSSYANTGATTGTRALWGFSDQAASTLDNADNAIGTRFCFEYINVNAGRVQTTINVSCRDGTTEALTDTGISITQNKWYDFWLHMQPWGACAWQIDDVVANNGAGDVLASGNTTTNIPGETTFMRIMATMRTINAVARNMKIARMVVIAGFDWVA